MIKEGLEKIVGAEAVLRQQPLSQYTSLKVGGAAEYLVKPKAYHEVAEIIAFCSARDIPWRVLGRGTNVLVSDQGLEGVVISLTDNLAKITVAGAKIIAQAGASLPRASSVALVNKLTGLEFAAGIPGSVGGAVVMNAGAYGGEMKDVLRRVQAVNSQGELVTFAAQEMELAYRSSVFQHNGHVVLEAELELVPGDPLAIQEKMDDFNRRRREKQPLEAASAGSTFKRPEGHYAGQLIESCNLRGTALGGAAVSEKHCGFIINTGQATAQDIYDLIRKVQAEVEKRHNVRLEPEVKIWGEFRDTR
ncbi:MAG: UDP-N-acetylmuramate dehydrogenase [Bacillota bacterium]|jgi:UDP-N-acetylmuramate dehydrogenase|nr:UDP-N-acetylmuramate dehydrogenase [Bacillota bacterium]HOC06566.1 UDP-N-acetylmuramate dehydrogenase [Bacillota bacterium]HPZ22898.1 UDP-N-acetylmuramate dehydrogenase [Bacillota bacterium]HQD19899.1 UDP-N-acetylmuramate dehydrogenase [Bacillota bacterium]